MIKVFAMKKKLLIALTAFAAASVLSMSCTKPTGEKPAEVPDPDAQYSGLTKVTFVESDKNIPNPERGFLTHLEFSTKSELVPVSKSSIESNYTFKRTLFFMIFYMEQFIDSPISEEYLQFIRDNMQRLREGGAKVVLRFAYNRSFDDKAHPWDATEKVVLSHVAQLEPIFKEYSDVIFVLEAGFVGTFGEWYYTDNFNFNPKTKEEYMPRRRLMDALLKALPKDRMVCVRYPAAKMMMYDLTVADSLTVNTAHDGSDISRVAAHNDCFVSSPNDVGTYGKPEERKYIYSESRYVILGGETCAVTAYSDCSRTMPKVKDHHLTYLNINYHQGVISKWKKEGCFEDIEKYMGYRLVMDKAFVTPEPKVGEKMRVVLMLRNVGYAAPMNPRDVEFVFVSKNGDKYPVKIDADPRFWFENGEYVIDREFDLPEGIKTGDYTLYLNLPDPKTTLRDNPRFSIQTANEGTWDEKTGYNRMADIKVR